MTFIPSIEQKKNMTESFTILKAAIDDIDTLVRTKSHNNYPFDHSLALHALHSTESLVSHVQKFNSRNPLSPINFPSNLDVVNLIVLKSRLINKSDYLSRNITALVKFLESRK